MKTVSLLLCFVASLASGQKVTRASIPNVITHTTTDLTLYVDPLGSDSNSCTATGTNACLTIQGALNKSPKMLRHRLTVNVAAGSYAGFTLSGFTIDPSVQKTTAGILIDGVLANSTTLAAGAVTGTASSGTAGSKWDHGTLTDTTQTWTTNDLRGRFISITGGTGSGALKMITSNTGTAITIAGTWTAPTGTSTYAIQDAAAIVTTTTAAIVTPTSATDMAAVGIQVANNTLGVSGIMLRNLSVTTASGVLVKGPQRVDLTQMQVSGSGNTLINISGQGAISTVTTTAVKITSTNNGVGAGSGAQVTLSGSVVFSLTGAGTGIYSNLGSRAVIVSSRFYTLIGMWATNSQGEVTVTNSQCDCASGASSACVKGGTSTSTLNNAMTASVGDVSVVNCTYGMWGVGQGVTLNAIHGLTGNALSYAINVSGGASASFDQSNLGGTSPLITAGTAELSIDDGAATTTLALLPAQFDCLNSLGTGSRICHQ